MTPTLRGEDLEFSYEPGKPVVSSVGMSVSAGAVTGIAGPNGSGKSTLLRLLAGLCRPCRGRVLLDGAPLLQTPPRARARLLAYLPQGVSPAFGFSALEVVCLGRYPHAGPLRGLGPHDLAMARGCMARTGTGALEARPFASLSGGERQRVLLAGVLAQEPRLLLLDEPTASLDLPHALEVFALLRGLARSGYGVGVVTHDLNLAAQYCDTLVLLGADHRCAAQGAPAEVLREEALSRAYAAPLRVGRHPFADAPFVAAADPRSAQP